MFTTDFKASAATEAIRRAAAQLEDMTPLFRDVVEYMIEATRQRFAKSQAPDGSTWAPKRPATLERYKRLGYGNLSKQLIGPGKRLSREIVGQPSRQGAVIGSALIYSRVMQDGADKGAFGADRHGRPIPWGRIPARTWLGISAHDETQIIDIADEYVGQGLGESG
jgi:phage virion morphogenesis protein